MYKILLMFLLSLILTGCATTPGYNSFYQPQSDAIYSPVAYSNVVVKLYNNDDEMKTDCRSIIDQGAALLGQAAWEGPYTEPNLAKWKAASVGADFVLVSIGYSHTRSGTMSLPQYHAGNYSTSSTYSSGNVYGYGGNATYSGHSTTTAYSPGYTTYNNIPYSVERYNHWAVFLRQDNATIATHENGNNSIPLPSADEDFISDARNRIAADADNPTNNFLRFSIADKYMECQHYPEAIVEYENVLESDTNNLFAMYQIGSALFQQNKHDEAIEQYKRMLIVKSDTAWAYHGLAESYCFGKKEISLAQDHWLRALDIISKHPDNYPAHLRARCHLGLAIMSYFDLKSPATGSDHAYQAGKIYIDDGDKADALDMVDMIKAEDPSSPLSQRLTDYIYDKEESNRPTDSIKQ